MNLFKKAYCRIFQLVFKIALPILPYRDPIIINNISSIPDTLNKEGINKVMIVTDKIINSLGLLDSLKTNLNDNNIPFVIFDDVVANPTSQNVLDAKKVYLDNNCRGIIAFGGGSAMDCAKGLGALIARPKKTLKQLGGILHVRKKIPTLIAIPTTAGTGSETTLACVVVDSETRHKYAINDFPLIPKYAVLDESVTMSLPDNVVSTTGMDALTHAIESFIGKSGNKSTRQDALDASKLIFENLLVSYHDKTKESRKNMLIASHKAGRSFSKAYVGYVHAIAHSLGGKYNIPHGLANAIILPIVLKEYGKKIHKKLYKLGLYCNLFDKNTSISDGAQIVIKKIEDMNKEMNIGNKIKGINKNDIQELAKYALKEANPLYPVPVLWDYKKIVDVYLKIGE